MKRPKIDSVLKQKLKERAKEGLLRKLTLSDGLVDLCSNDYLGFAKGRSDFNSFSFKQNFIGSTGSRLLSGNSALAEDLEIEIAKFHNAPAGLIFNSGYDANLGLFSSVPQRGDTILYDELIHASVRDGVRLSFANNFSFKHNDLTHLEDRLKKASGEIYVAVESVYSMDGDYAPLKELVKLCASYNANLIVDEAHATGVFGDKGQGRVQELGLDNKIFARVHTFGKALGCHGAIVLGSEVLKDYLVNFSRSFIYTTALPPLSLMHLMKAYERLETEIEKIKRLHELVAFFKTQIDKLNGKYDIIESDSPIQCIIIPGNEEAKLFSDSLRKKGFDIRPILYPTVPKGKERLRICLHAFNSEKEIEAVIKCLDIPLSDLLRREGND